MGTMGARIKKAREERGLYQAQLAEMIGVKSAAVISNWEKDVNKPDAEKIVKLCEALDISASYLLDYAGRDSMTFTVAEMRLIKKFRRLDPHGEAAVYAILDVELSRLDSKQPRVENLTIYPTRYFLQAASAGTGEFSTDDFEDLDLVKRPPAGTTYIVHVAGDSMEPTYYDGDKLFVSQQTTIRPGEIGIFNQDGQSYVKELGKGFLVSHNPAYTPIKLDSTIRCQGKVLGVCTDDYLE